MTSGRLVRLRPKTIDDASADYLWRRDAELASFDALPPLNLSFEQYLREYRIELSNLGPKRRRYAIETADGLHIGNCSLYNVDDRKRQCELGIMIGDRQFWNRGYGQDTVRTLIGHAFLDLPVDRVYLFTLEWNVRAQHSFVKAGFREHSRTADDRNRFVIMEIYRDQYLADEEGRR